MNRLLPFGKGRIISHAMSRFSDFDEFLRRQEKAADESIKKLQQSRDDYDALIREIFRVFQEYFDTVIKPRKNYFVIAKKKEALPQSHHHRSGVTPYYLYRINLVPKDTLPLSLTPLTVTNSDFVKPGEVSKNDWHPYVALQFDIALHDAVDEERLIPSVSLRLWGELGKEDFAVLEREIAIKTLTSPLSRTTEVTITASHPDQLVVITTRALMTLSPYILSRE